MPGLAKARVGLLAHPASVTKHLVHALPALRGIGIHPKRLFGPEHGWAGHAQDMIGVGDSEDVVSLYGENYADLTPKPEHLAGLDVVLVDLQDVGARYYTFVWTAVLVARACKQAGVRVVILDRPNPIGRLVEGRLQDASFLSFVGLEQIPIRHGLTVGEVVAWRGKTEGFPVEVIRAEAEGIAQPPWVLPSPNMPTRDTALVYPGGCLLEGTNLSDGRGTTRPFEITGAPWIDGQKACARPRGDEIARLHRAAALVRADVPQTCQTGLWRSAASRRRCGNIPSRRDVCGADRALPSAEPRQAPIPYREIRIRRRQTGLRYFDGVGDRAGAHFERR